METTPCEKKTKIQGRPNERSQDVAREEANVHTHTHAHTEPWGVRSGVWCLAEILIHSDWPWAYILPLLIEQIQIHFFYKWDANFNRSPRNCREKKLYKSRKSGYSEGRPYKVLYALLVVLAALRGCLPLCLCTCWTRSGKEDNCGTVRNRDSDHDCLPDKGHCPYDRTWLTLKPFLLFLFSHEPLWIRWELVGWVVRWFPRYRVSLSSGCIFLAQAPM